MVQPTYDKCSNKAEEVFTNLWVGHIFFIINNNLSLIAEKYAGSLNNLVPGTHRRKLFDWNNVDYMHDFVQNQGS